MSQRRWLSARCKDADEAMSRWFYAWRTSNAAIMLSLTSEITDNMDRLRAQRLCSVIKSFKPSYLESLSNVLNKKETCTEYMWEQDLQMMCQSKFHGICRGKVYTRRCKSLSCVSACWDSHSDQYRPIMLDYWVCVSAGKVIAVIYPFPCIGLSSLLHISDVSWHMLPRSWC